MLEKYSTEISLTQIGKTNHFFNAEVGLSKICIQVVHRFFDFYICIVSISLAEQIQNIIHNGFAFVEVPGLFLRPVFLSIYDNIELPATL